MEDGLCEKGTGDDEGVSDGAVLEVLEKFRVGDFLDFNFFVFVEVCGLCFLGVEGDKEVAEVVLDGGVDVYGAGCEPVVAGVSGFFLEFSLRGLEGCFVWVDGAAGNFEGDLVGAVSVLSDGDDVSVGGECEDVDPAWEVDDEEVAFQWVGL